VARCYLESGFIVLSPGEIAENLHRADLTALERSEHIAEWIKLTGEKVAHAAQLAPHGKAGQQSGGTNAAVRELGIDRTDAQRAVRVAGLSEPAKDASARGQAPDYLIDLSP
jgi:ParB family chromosome partitioning protein